MKIAVGGDSAGEGLAQQIVAHLKAKGLDAVDLSRPVDEKSELYSELSERVGHAILSGEYARGILCCGTGIGVAISANKIPGIRAAQVHDSYSAERAALSNDAHIITLGARVVGAELAKTIVDSFLAKKFDPASASARNVDGINALDRKYSPNSCK